MTQTVVERRSSLSWWVRSLLALVAFVTAIFVIVCLGIVHAASQQEIRKADAIVVFGAAEYAGRPSPVYRARLDHAFDLYQRGVALVVITTGGSAEDPSFSEGGVGHDYLLHRGVGEAALIAGMLGAVPLAVAGASRPPSSRGMSKTLSPRVSTYGHHRGFGDRGCRSWRCPD